MNQGFKEVTVWLVEQGSEVILGKPGAQTKTHPNTSCIIKPSLRPNVQGALNDLFISWDHINRGS